MHGPEKPVLGLDPRMEADFRKIVLKQQAKAKYRTLRSFHFSGCSAAQRPRLAHSIGEQNDQRQYQRQTHETLRGNVCGKF